MRVKCKRGLERVHTLVITKGGWTGWTKCGRLAMISVNIPRLDWEVTTEEENCGICAIAKVGYNED